MQEILAAKNTTELVVENRTSPQPLNRVKMVDSQPS